MKKILFIHHAKGWGGSPINMINIINSLDKQKYDVEVFLIKDSIVSNKLKENKIKYSVAKSKFYKFHYHSFIHTDAYFVKWFQLIRLLRLSILWLLSRYHYASKELCGFNYDIAHLNSSVLTDWLAPCSKKGQVIYHIQEPISFGTFGFRYNFFRNQVSKYATHIIAISKDHLYRISLPFKTTVIYNYAEIPKSNPDDLSYSSKVAIYLGGAEQIKGFFTVVSCLKYLNPNIMIKFAGDYETIGNPLYIIKSVINFKIFLEIRKRIAINIMRNHPNAIEIGPLSNISEAINSANCLISPFSVPHFSRPVIEAHLHKKPAIGTNVNGMDEIIEHEQDGLIIPKNDPNKLAQAIIYLTSNPTISKKYGESGYYKSIENFSPSNIIKYQYLYDKLLAQKNV